LFQKSSLIYDDEEFHHLLDDDSVDKNKDRLHSLDDDVIGPVGAERWR